MKKLVIVMLCVIAIFSAETAIFFGINCDKLENQKRILMKSNHELMNENKDLRQKILEKQPNELLNFNTFQK